MGHPDVDTGSGFLEVCGGYRCVFDRISMHFEEQSVHGVEADGFGFGDPEGLGFKRKHILFEKSPLIDVVLALFALCFAVESFVVPTVAGQGTEASSPVEQELPKLIGVRYAPRQTASDPHDRDGLGG